MLNRFSLGLVLLALSLAPGCGGNPSCVIDTDCPLGQRCSVDMQCEPIGDVEDSGTGGVDAARSDSGSVDAGPVDARATDGGSADSGASDSGSVDAGGCMATLGTYTLMSSPAACPTTISTITVAAGASACEVVLTSREEPSFGGTVTSTGGGRSFSGALSIGVSSYPSCTVTFSTGAMSIDCGGECVLPATMP